MIIILYIHALLLTVLIELGVTLFFNFQNKKILVTVLAVNLITHPSLHIILVLMPISNAMKMPIILFLELLVVFVEWKIIEVVMKCKSTRCLALSVAMNTISYFIGVMIQWTI